jgi:hypothetical protein
MSAREPRPIGLVALTVFSVFGAVMSGLTAVLLLKPGSRLDALWRLNPTAQEKLTQLGLPAVLLMGVVSVACMLTAVGIWRGKRWGHRLACTVLVVNATGDVVSAIVRSDPRTLIGLPIVGVALWYLTSRGVRRYFSAPN